jgi:hypothetical protein
MVFGVISGFSLVGNVFSTKHACSRLQGSINMCGRREWNDRGHPGFGVIQPKQKNKLEHLQLDFVINKYETALTSQPMHQWRPGLPMIAWQMLTHINRVVKIYFYPWNNRPGLSIWTADMRNMFSSIFGEDELWRQYTVRNFSSVKCHPEIFDYYSQFVGVPILKDKYG